MSNKPIYGIPVGGGGGQASNYKHPETHPAAMITGLADVATSGSYNDLTNKPNIPNKVSDLDNDKGYLTDYTETDPTVPSWAKAPTKPTYTADEVGALPDTTVIPGALADLSSDSTHRTVTDAEKEAWNAKSDFSGSYNDLENVPSEFNPTAHEHNYISTSQKGTASGVATLDENGHIPSTQLPSYVDEVIEGYISDDKKIFYEDSEKAKTVEAKSGKIYVDIASLRTYRWGSTQYAEISESLALGETSSTAYYGDKGKVAYEHSQKTSGNPHGVTKSDVGLSNVENKSSATIRDELTSANVTKALGYTPIEKTYEHPTSHPAGMITGLAKVATSGNYEDLGNKPTIPEAYSHPSTHPASMITGLSTVATSGSYNDLTNKPTIPTVPTDISAFNNDKGYLTSDTETDPTVPEYIKNISTDDIDNWDTAYAHSKSPHARTDATKVEGSSNGKIKINDTDTTVYSHPSSGITAGTYRSVTVNAQGHVTAGSNPTTLAGYGITDGETKGTASTSVSTHNASTSAHNDIRDLISGLTTRLNTLANSTDEDLDQLAEIVAYIKANKGLIGGITTSKVNVSDIIDNLTTNVSDKPLSAAQGIIIKGLIDDLQLALDNHAHDDIYATKTELTATQQALLDSLSAIEAKLTQLIGGGS